MERKKAKSPPTKKMAAPSTNVRSEMILGKDFPDKYPVGWNAQKKAPATTSTIDRTARTRMTLLRNVYLSRCKRTLPSI
ncbi:MAG: hypothetical protein ABSB28_07000 [Candidatus Bathyarchaeia archaeon]